ncbi:MAG: hypothetical protein LC799_31085, partial [Actinobacteria bacterium]|nr:hypothetical protein [Actinomycetota bacterium]
MASIRTTVVLTDAEVDELVAVIRRGQGGRPVIGRDRTTWIGLVVVALLSFAALGDLATHCGIPHAATSMGRRTRLARWLGQQQLPH